MMDPTEYVDVRAEEFDARGCSPMLLFWHVTEGAFVSEGQGLCEVETSKSVVLVCSPATGVLVEIFITPGEPVGPGQALARIKLG